MCEIQYKRIPSKARLLNHTHAVPWSKHVGQDNWYSLKWGYFSYVTVMYVMRWERLASSNSHRTEVWRKTIISSKQVVDPLNAMLVPQLEITNLSLFGHAADEKKDVICPLFHHATTFDESGPVSISLCHSLRKWSLLYFISGWRKSTSLFFTMPQFKKVILSLLPWRSSRKLFCLFYHDAVQESYLVSFTNTQFKKVILSPSSCGN